MSLSRIVDGFSIWIDVVAEAFVAAIARLRKVPSVRLIEGDGGAFSLSLPDAGMMSAHPPFRLHGDAAASGLPEDIAAHLRGREVELVLLPTHFLFRPLELPRRAAEFLDGIVRAQIDRLTPWSANEAVFAWSPPAEAGDDRIGLTIAATARSQIEPYLHALKALGAKSIVVSTSAGGGATGPELIKVYRHTLSGVLGVARIRKALLVVLVAVTAAATLSTAASQIIGADLNARLDDLNNRITAQRLALTARQVGGESLGLQALERRKHDSAATVLVLEALSRALPDHTYVTEVHVEGGQLQVIGISRDAPSLIRLMEQSSHFLQATFVAPTTRVPEEPGERFHIEAKIKIPFEVTP